jgi:EspG family
MDNRRYLLTGVEFEVLWTELSVTPPPAVLHLDSLGRSHAERRRVRAAVGQALRDRGLVDAAGPDPELVGLLRSLAHPAQQLELRARWGEPLRAVAAERDGAGVLAVRRADTVLVTGCDSLPTALLGALPPARPGPGQASRVPAQALAGAAAGGALVPGLVAARVPLTEARVLDRMLSSVERRAQVVALVESAPDGGLRRHGGVVGVLGGPAGRYLVTRSTGPDGTDWITVAPCDPRRLRHRVAGLLPPAAGRAITPAVPSPATRRRSGFDPPPLRPPRRPR